MVIFNKNGEEFKDMNNNKNSKEDMNNNKNSKVDWSIIDQAVIYSNLLKETVNKFNKDDL
jgi:hypothetical protein